MRLVELPEEEQKEIIELLNEASEEIQNLYGHETDLSERLWCKTLEIEQLSTAYDVEKVVEKLREHNYYSITVDEAVKIVEGGGLDE